MNTTYYKNLMAGNAYGKRSTIPASYYAALSTAAPGTNGASFKEPTGGAYARVAITNDTANFTAPNNGVVANAKDIEWVQSTADWGTILAYGVYDAATGGNLLFYNTLPKSKVMQSEDIFIVKAGKLQLSVTD